MPAKAVAEATRRARSSGRSVSIDVPPDALAGTSHRKQKRADAHAGGAME